MKNGEKNSFKNEENVPEDSIIMCITFQLRTLFAFSFLLFIIMYFYKAPFYHNVTKV